jgi:hypothetical protein
MPLNLTAQQRIARSIVVDDNGCWIWQRAINRDGYGRIRVDKRAWLVHRLAYTLSVGAIPNGLDLDHLCRVRACCNPSHVQPVDRKTNVLRGEHPNVVLHHVGQCKHGHVIDTDNAYVRPDGRLKCAECTRAAVRQRRANAAVARTDGAR